MPYIIDRGALYGQDVSTGPQDLDAPEPIRQKVVVEFSSPNLGKEFDGSHLRSTIIGAFISSVYESMGWDVCRMNFLGDWGKHIGLLAAGWSRFGSEELFQADPLRHLLDVYMRIEELFKPEQEAAKKLRAEHHDTSEIESKGISAEKDEFFKKMEDHDPDALALWQRFRDVCIAKYTEIYGRLNIHFDDYSGESEVKAETIAEVEALLKEKAVYKDSEHAWVIDFTTPESQGLGTAIARFRNGTTSYLLRDIAAAVERDRKYSFQKMVYVVSARQSSHFQQLFKALELMGLADLASRLEHVEFGRVKGLSPKEGTRGLLLSDILDQCGNATDLSMVADPETSSLFHGEGTNIADVLGGINLMVEDLSIRRGSNFVFDLNKMATGGEYTGLNLQKWHTMLSRRLTSVVIDRDQLACTDYTMLEEDAYADILRLLLQFPGTVKSSFKALESSNILTLLFNIINLLPNLWEEEDEAEGSQQSLARLAFYKCVHHVMENGMRIVGLMPLTTSASLSF